VDRFIHREHRNKENNMIQILDVIEYYRNQPNQNEAIAYLQANIPQNVLVRFAEIWRKPEPKPEPESVNIIQQRKINKAGLYLLKEFEGLVLYTYDDGVGVPTIGYGHTKGVLWGMIISESQAEKFLKEDLEYFEAKVTEMVTVRLTENQYSAIVSLCYNIGEGALGGSTLMRLLNDGDYQGAANQFGRWINGGGNVMEGLVRMREAERELFLTGD